MPTSPASNPDSDRPVDPHPLVGIEIGGTKLQIVIGDDRSVILGRWRGDADRSGGGPAIQRQIARGLAELLDGRSPAAIGVGFGGPIDVSTGRIRRSHQIDGWEDFPLRDWLGELTGSRVCVENDANTAALGEAIHGAGRGADPVFYCNFGSGVGGGLVVGGNVYHGRPPGEMEFGHLRVNSGLNDATTVEDHCSGWAVDRKLRAAANARPDTDLARRLGASAGGEARHLPSLLAAGDPDAAGIFSDLCSSIALNLSHVVHLLNPSAIVLGGGLAMIGQPLRDGVADRLPGVVMEALHPVPDVRLAALGEDAVPVGALELARRIATIGVPF